MGNLIYLAVVHQEWKTAMAAKLKSGKITEREYKQKMMRQQRLVESITLEIQRRR